MSAEVPVTARIAAVRNSLQPSERRVADLIVDDPDAVIELTAQQIADRVGVGRSTVVRACQTFGYRGYPQLRVALAAERGRRAVPPVAELPPHAADLGMTFYNGKQFPASYKGGIFIAEHGSWNRTEPVGARVMFAPMGADGKLGAVKPFAEGWLTGDGEYLGRPVDVAVMLDGSLLVSDDSAGAIYRISYEK